MKNTSRMMNAYDTPFLKKMFAKDVWGMFWEDFEEAARKVWWMCFNEFSEVWGHLAARYVGKKLVGGLWKGITR